MLCLQDLRVHFFLLHLYSCVGCLPFRICTRHGTVTAETRIWKKILYYMHQVLTTTHLVFTMARFIQGVMKYQAQSETGKSDLKIHNFGCVFICCSFSLLSRITGHVALQQNLKIFNGISNNIVAHFAGSPNKKFTLRRLFQMSLQELFAITIGAIMPVLVLLHLVLYFWHPMDFNFLYSVFPSRWHQKYPTASLFLGAILEMYLTTLFLSVVHWGVNLLILFFKISETSMTAGIKRLEKQLECGVTAFDIQQALKQCRELQLWLTIFNGAISNVLFAVKQIVTANAVFVLFISIDGVRRGNLMIAGIFFPFGVVIGLAFPIIFNDTFIIPEKCAEFKKVIRQASHVLRRKNELKYQECTKSAASIMEIGIKQGGFNQFERTSTPNFIDFVIGNVVDLLITF